MEYPRPVMKLMDMVRELGLPELYLRRAVHSKYSDKFAFRTSKKGDWLFITAEFEKLRKRKVFEYQHSKKCRRKQENYE